MQSREDLAPSYWFQSGLLLLPALFLEMLSHIFHACIISFLSNFTPDGPEWGCVHDGVGVRGESGSSKTQRDANVLNSRIRSQHLSSHEIILLQLNQLTGLFPQLEKHLKKKKSQTIIEG